MAKGAYSQNETAWRDRLRQHADSGQSVRAWCRKHRVSEAAFYWWRRELARRDEKTQAAWFVPVQVTDNPAQDGDPQIEIVLADGRCVRITGRVNREALTEVLNVLERRAC